MLNKAMLMACGYSGEKFAPTGEMFARYRITVGLYTSRDANGNYVASGGKGFMLSDLVVSGVLEIPSFGQSVTLAGGRDLYSLYDTPERFENGKDLLNFTFSDLTKVSEYVAVLNETNGKFAYGQWTGTSYYCPSEDFFEGIEEGQTCYVSIYEHSM